jgi:hypothetical protein
LTTEVVATLIEENASAGDVEDAIETIADLYEPEDLPTGLAELEVAVIEEHASPVEVIAITEEVAATAEEDLTE